MPVRYTPGVADTSPPDRDAVELRAFLADRDVACPGCGYNLRGLTTGECPECGARPRLDLLKAGGRIGPVYLPIAAILLNILLFVFGASRYLLWRGPEREFWVHVGFHFAVVLVSAIGFVRAISRCRTAPDRAWRWAGIVLLALSTAAILRLAVLVSLA
jgi:hypothetical protein